MTKNHRPLHGWELDLLAWDISDAIAKTSDGTGVDIDVGLTAIRPHLQAFIDACLATQAELDKEEETNEL